MNPQEVDNGKKGYLSSSEFREFVERLRHRSDIQEVYDSMAKDGMIDEATFREFLKHKQLVRRIALS